MLSNFKQYLTKILYYPIFYVLYPNYNLTPMLNGNVQPPEGLKCTGI